MNLAWRARHDGKGVPGGPIQVTAASDQALGAGDGPLQAIPAALFVQAVADVEIEATGGLRGWLAGKPLAVSMIFLPAAGGAAHARTPAALVAQKQSVGGDSGAAVRGRGAEVLTPRSLLAGDPQGHLDRVRRLLAGQE